MKYIEGILNITNSISEKYFRLILVVLIFGTCLFRCFHGIDLTDSGWVLTGYQQIFQHPNSVETMFYMYDTLLIGGIWETILGGLGIIGYKILSAIFLTAIVGLVYFLLRSIVNRWIILFCSMLLILTGRYMVFHYDVSSAFFALLCVSLIIQSLTKRNKWLIFWAGVTLGIGAFIRFPNLALIGLILVLVPFYIKARDTHLSFILLLYAVIGFIVGLLSNLAVVLMLGHWDYMMNMFELTFTYLSKSDSSHNLPTMLHFYRWSYGHVLWAMYPFAFYPCLCYLIERYEEKRWLRIVTMILVDVLFCIVLYRAYVRNIAVLHAMCCAVFIYVYIRRKKYAERTIYLIVLSFLLMLLLPLGSDGGLFNVGINSLFLSVPLAVGVAWNELTANTTLCNKLLKVSIVCFLGITSVSAMYMSLSNSYRDTGSIFLKTAQVKQARTMTTFTDLEKANILDNLLEHIVTCTDSESELLAYPSIPIINYLSNTKPYLGGAWIGILNFTTFERVFYESEKSKPLPIIVISKAPDKKWYIPNAEWKTIDDCNDWHPSISEKNELLKSFVYRHPYDIYYEDLYFQVLIPNKIQQ